MGPSNEKSADTGGGHGEWLVNVADDVVVPMTTFEVIDGLRKGKLSEQSLVWRIGMHDWTPVLDVPQLRLVVGSRPPPPAAASVTQPLYVVPAPRPAPAGAAHRLTPAPTNAAAFTQTPTPYLPHSLAPTTAEADLGQRRRAPGTWADFDELLTNERRADQRNSRRVLLAASLASAALAAGFALWVLRSPAPRAAPAAPPATQPSPAAQPSLAPLLAPTPEASAAPTASAIEPVPAARVAAPQPVRPRVTRKPKPLVPVEGSARAPDAPSTALDSADTTPKVAAVPAAPPEPAPASTALPTATSTAASAPNVPNVPNVPNAP